MIAFKILLVLFFMGWAFLLLIVAGETHAMNKPNSKFTKWWRENWIGIEDKLDSRKQNKK
jgi:hypothetical protein